MDNKTNIQNLPQTLDLNLWLMLSLASTNELNRQIALEEMLTNGYTSDFDNILKELAEKDPSLSCRNQASWLIKTKEAKKELKTLIRQLDVNPEYIAQQIQKGNFAHISQCCQLLKKSPSEDTLNKWRQVIQNSNAPRLIEAGLNILGKFGNQTDTPLVINHLKSQDSQVVCSALSFLAQKDQATFKKCIRFGLTNKAANILLHSVHLLRTADEAETIKYLSNLILNKNALVRQKALRELMLIDFVKVQDLFWQYIGREDQAFLLVKAGYLVTFNPNPHYPFKIYDILSISAGLKKHIMQLILKQSLETTQAAGVLKDKNINTLIAEIQQYINNKKTEQLIRVSAANLKASESNIRLSAIDVLSQYISHPQIRALLENQLKIETDTDVKTALIALFEDNTEVASANTNGNNNDSQQKPEATVEVAQEQKAESKDSPIVFPPANDFVKLPIKEQRALLNQIDCIEKYPIAKKTLVDSVDFANLKKATLLEVLKKIGAYGNSADAKAIYHMTKSKDNSVVAQTVKTVGTIDLDLILPELNIFLAHDDPRIKSAAFEVYILADKPAAVQYVATMLKQTNIPIKRIGISLLPLLDYPSVEPLLWWLLSHDDNVEIQDQAGYMVAANPTQEGISRLYEFTHDNNGEMKEGFSEMWSAGLTSAESVFGKPAKAIEEDCWNNMLNDKNAEDAEKSDYKFKSVVGENEEIAAELEEHSVTPDGNFLEKILLLVFTYKKQCIAGACILALIAYLTYEPDEQIQHSRNKEVASEVNFVPREASDKTTQVGGDDWQGAIRSGAREILNSKQYASLMQSAAQEQQDFREEAEKKQKEYFRELANDPTADQEDRDWAAANLNDDYADGKKAFSANNFKDAEYLLERAANSASLNTYGKLDAMQSLMEIYATRNDKQSWEKWLGRLLKELKTVPEFSKIEVFDHMDQTLGQIESISDSLKKNPQAQAEMKEAMKTRYKMNEQEAEKAVNDLMEFKHPFNANNLTNH